MFTSRACNSSVITMKFYTSSGKAAGIITYTDQFFAIADHDYTLTFARSALQKRALAHEAAHVKAIFTKRRMLIIRDAVFPESFET